MVYKVLCLGTSEGDAAKSICMTSCKEHEGTVTHIKTNKHGQFKILLVSISYAEILRNHALCGSYRWAEPNLDLSLWSGQDRA
uniref:Uncharacterized protein n=1 Tax=Lactuca sativa TaxID=4236 RepID=A0A9R1V3E7_LACSA|nr:hypothetical protein LSAT_V11C600337410 [Lactuca sativa]